MAESSHPLDSIADDLFSWQEEMVEWAVEDMKAGHRAPFSAGVSEREKLDYYSRQMFQASPDGTVNYDQPNPGGRDRLMKALGPTGYVQVWDAVRPKIGLQSPSMASSDEQDTSMPTMPEDQPDSGL